MTKLSGMVAIIKDAKVVEVRDLGPEPIEVKPERCKPLVEDKPTLDEGEQLVGPTYTIREKDVLASYTKKDAATVVDEEKDSEVASFGKLDFEVAFNHENRIRVLEGKNAISKAQFLTALKALL